jgi:phage terminase large subunit-like protein
VEYDVWAEDGLLMPSPGRSVDYDWVAAQIVPVLSNMDVRAVAYDRWQFEHLKQAFSRHGYDPEFMTDFGQGFKTMTPALRTFETLALDGRLRHGKNPILTWNASNARAKPGDGGERKLTKSKSIGRIDGLVATVMAIHAATADQTPESIYDVLDRIDGKQKPAEPAQSDAKPVQAGADSWSADVLRDPNHADFARHKALFEAWQDSQADEEF